MCVCAFQSRDCLLLQFKGASEGLRIWRVITIPFCDDRLRSFSILGLCVSLMQVAERNASQRERNGMLSCVGFYLRYAMLECEFCVILCDAV